MSLETRELNLEEKNQLSDLFDHPPVRQIVKHMQFCLFKSDITIYTLASHSAKEIRKCYKPRRLLASVHENLEKIMLNVIESLSAQKDEFIHQFAHSLLIDEVDEGTSLEDLSNPQKILFLLRNHVTKSCLHLNIQNDRQRLEIKLDRKILTKIGHFAASVKQPGPDYFWMQMICGYCALILSMLKLSQDFYKSRSMDISSQLSNLVFIIVPLVFIFYPRYERSRSYSRSKKEIITFPAGRGYKLEEIVIVDFKLEQERSQGFLPIWQKGGISQEEKADFGTGIKDSRDEVEEKGKLRLMHKRVLTKTKQQVSGPPRPISSSGLPKWHAENTLFGESKGIIPNSEIHELYAPFFSGKTRYFGFFNRKALEKQGLRESGKEWKSYEARVKNGAIVPGEAQTGIKQLRPKILTDVRICGENFGLRLFEWSAKEVGTINRLLGTPADFELDSEGVRYELVDFCWHWSKGPGH